MTLEKYEEHEYYCHLPKCQNSMCGVGTEKLIVHKQDDEEEHKFCSEMCKFSHIFQRLVKKKYASGRIMRMVSWFCEKHFY